jgi:hypothetical protein
MSTKISAILAVVAIIAVCFGYVKSKDAEMLQQQLNIATASVSNTAQKQEIFDGIHKEMDAVASELESVSEDSFRAYLDKPLPDDAIRMLKQHSPNKL